MSGEAPVEDRENVGFVQVIAPIIVEMVPVVIKAVELTVVVVVSAVVVEEVVETAKRRRTKKEEKCYELLDECLDYRPQPDSNKETFGPMKNCRACFDHCVKDGVWPYDKCPLGPTRQN